MAETAFDMIFMKTPPGDIDPGNSYSRAFSRTPYDSPRSASLFRPLTALGSSALAPFLCFAPYSFYLRKALDEINNPAKVLSFEIVPAPLSTNGGDILGSRRERANISDFKISKVKDATITIFLKHEQPSLKYQGRKQMGRTEIQVIMRSAKKGYFAHGVFDGKGLTVYAGSQVSDSVRSSIKGNLSVMRSMHLDDEGRTIGNIYFKSPSAASNFVCGRSSNGWVEWVTPEGVKLSAYRDIGAGSAEPFSGSTTTESSIDDEQKNGRSHKVSTESILQDLVAHDSNVRIVSKDRHTVLYYRDSIVASIYYRANAIRIEMRDTTAVHTLYDELLSESLAYQKLSVNPYVTRGKYAFFVNAKDEETVLLAILIAVQDGRLSPSQPADEKKPATEKAETSALIDMTLDEHAAYVTSDKSMLPQPTGIPANTGHQEAHATDAQASDTPKEPKRVAPDAIQQVQPQVITPQDHFVVVPPPEQVKMPEDSGRLEKKLDSLLGVIANMYSGKASTSSNEASKPEETDKRFKLEPTQGNAPMLMLRKPMAITGLIFAMKLYAIGMEGSSERYRIFFANSLGEQLSEAQLIETVAGGEYICRFELKSSASEEKVIYLAVQGINAEANEARQLIECPVKIAFAADFGL